MISFEISSKFDPTISGSVTMTCEMHGPTCRIVACRKILVRGVWGNLRWKKYFQMLQFDVLWSII